MDTGQFPGGTASYGENSTSCGGWDTSREDKDGDGIPFLDPLVDQDYMLSIAKDPNLDSASSGLQKLSGHKW